MGFSDYQHRMSTRKEPKHTWTLDFLLKQLRQPEKQKEEFSGNTCNAASEKTFHIMTRIYTSCTYLSVDVNHGW